MSSSDDFGDLSSALAESISDDKGSEPPKPQKVDLDELALSLETMEEPAEESLEEDISTGLSLDDNSLSLSADDEPEPTTKESKQAFSSSEIDYSSLAFEDEGVGKAAEEVSKELEEAETPLAKDAFGRSPDDPNYQPPMRDPFGKKPAAAAAATGAISQAAPATVKPAVTNHQFQAPQKEIKVYAKGDGSMTKLILFGAVGCLLGTGVWAFVVAISFGFIGWIALFALSFIIATACNIGGEGLEPTKIKVCASVFGVVGYVLGYFIIAMVYVTIMHEDLKAEYEQMTQQTDEYFEDGEEGIWVEYGDDYIDFNTLSDEEKQDFAEEHGVSVEEIEGYGEYEDYNPLDDPYYKALAEGSAFDLFKYLFIFDVFTLIQMGIVVYFCMNFASPSND